LVVQGIQQAGEALVSHRVELDEMTAIESALDSAPKDALVVIFPEQVSRAIALIQARNPVDEGAAATPELSMGASSLKSMSIAGE
ncbi:MAG: hypothetical protein AAF722_11440, partial [Cyanobacteria bacterium P01_C01_bin.70]